MPLLQKDIRKLQPPAPKSIRRDTTSPYATADSNKTSSSQEVIPQSSATNPSSTSMNRTSKLSLRNGNESDGRGGGYSSSPSSPVVYWSEFENPVQVPYTIEVDEHAPLLPWLYRRRKADVETASIEHLNSGSASSFTRALDKIREVVKWEVKTSAEGLTTLFYEKEFLDSDDEEEVESPSDESSSDVNATHALPRRHRHSIRRPSDREISRSELLNRGYYLCVVGCVLFCCFLGSVGLIFNGDTTGIAFVLVGFLISMSLEIVSLVRFIMYLPSSDLTGFLALLTDVTGKVATPELPGLAWLLLR